MVTDRGYVEELADVEDDFDRWCVEIVRKAEMTDDSPVRSELGPQDDQAEHVMVVRRDTSRKQLVLISAPPKVHPSMLDEIQSNMYEKARGMLEENSKRANEYARLHERASGNAEFTYAFWCGSVECLNRVKAATHATIRWIPFSQSEQFGSRIFRGSESLAEVMFARAY